MAYRDVSIYFQEKVHDGPNLLIRRINSDEGIGSVNGRTKKEERNKKKSTFSLSEITETKENLE